MATLPFIGVGTTAFVTGAAGGLGRAFTDRLLASGVRVWGTARDLRRLEGLRTHAGFTPVLLDLDDRETAARAYAEAAHAADGGFDLVINNAGYGVFGPADSSAPALWTRQIDAMLGTTLLIAQLALRDMTRRGRGCLVNTSSLAVEFPIPFMSGYNACKAGLSAWSETVLTELAHPDILIIDFRPGDFRTDFNRAAVQSDATRPPRAERVWQRLEETLAAAPTPDKAAADLFRAVLRRRCGVVRSGSFFQARVAPLFARVVPQSCLRAMQSRYFHLT